MSPFLMGLALALRGFLKKDVGSHAYISERPPERHGFNCESGPGQLKLGHGQLESASGQLEMASGQLDLASGQLDL